MGAEGQGFLQRIVDTIANIAKGGWRAITAWNFENRADRNKITPSSSADAEDNESHVATIVGDQNKMHDNGVGKSEIKVIFADGSEAIYDGDTMELITTIDIRGTYNYVNPTPGTMLPTPANIGHFFMDIVPHVLLGGSGYHRQ